MSDAAERTGSTANEASPIGTSAMSPYATGGGGVTFERKVAANYLARLFTGLGAQELGDGRSVVSVAFQQAPLHSADDLVICAKLPEEFEPSLVLALAVRRAPSIVQSDEKTKKLIGTLLNELAKLLGNEVEHRVGLVVAGYQTHAAQLAELAGLAAGQSEPSGFYALAQEPGRFERGVRDRLTHVTALVKLALTDAGDPAPDDATVKRQTWLLLSRLEVVMPRFESPDDADWAEVANNLAAVSRSSDVAGGTVVRDRLAALAADYGPKAAVIDLTLLRRDAYHVITPTTRRHDAAWLLLDGLHARAISAVRGQVTSSNGAAQAHIDRSATITELLALSAARTTIIVHGESGVGKSALLVEAASVATEAAGESQALVINLRHLPTTAIELEHALGAPLSVVLAEMSAPERILIIDGADAFAEGKSEQLYYLVDAAIKSDLHLVVLTANDTRKPLHDAIAERATGSVVDYEVGVLTDPQVDELVAIFPQLGGLAADVHARTLLRRLVVVDLLVRGGLSGLPVTDADAMQQVWVGLVRRNEQSDRGMPAARDAVMLRLADLELTDADPLPVVAALDAVALDGLRRDGLLRIPTDQPFRIGPEFAHDEVRRYAVARLLLGSADPTVRLLATGMPRWALSAARLACQIYLAAPDSASNPVHSRFARLQRAHGAVVEAGYGERWADVPGEALLTLADPGALLADAWDYLCADDKAGLHRLCRLVDQRFRSPAHLVRTNAVEPVIKQLFARSTPWLADKKLYELVRDWLRALVHANTPAGDALRAQLRTQLLTHCAQAEERMKQAHAAAEAARAARARAEVERPHRLSVPTSMFGEIGYGGRRRRRRPGVPGEIRDEVMVELLALLGPDLDDDGEAVLRRVATDAPADLGPALEGALAGRALAMRPRGFLAEMTQAYYLDDEEDGSGFHEDGIRDHDFHGIGMPFAAWYRGPFMPLLQTDFRGGVEVLNRMLNHAALARVRGLASIGYYGGPVPNEKLDEYRTDLEVTGAVHTYVGDAQVWTWYRGTGVGPYPCMSALQALELVCDQFIEAGIPLGTIVPTLLDGCENLAMVGFVVGLLVRHIDEAVDLLDPYLAEPMAWHFEFGRVVSEASGLRASSEGVFGAERRQWSLREAAMILAVQADPKRADELRRIGQLLVERAEATARAWFGDEADEEVIAEQLVSVRGWASGMDRSTYSAQTAENGQVLVQSTPSPELLEALESGSVDIRRAHEAARLLVAYYINPKKGEVEPPATDVLVADLAVAKQLIDDPPLGSAGALWDAPVAVAAASLEAHLVMGLALPESSLKFAAETVVTIAGLEDQGRQFDSEEAYFEQGADRVAARILPLLLTPNAVVVRSLLDGGDGSEAYAQIIEGARGLATALPNEVRLHLARGFDCVWREPCSADGPCHHEAAFDLITETMRDAALGNWDPEGQERTTVQLEDPIAESLQAVADHAIDFHRLDAALRALAPASRGGICVSEPAKDLLATVLAAQRRALLSHEDNTDHRGTHSLVAARALISTIESGDDTALFEHLDTFADRPDLLAAFLRAVSAAGEETEARAAVAARVWPGIVKRVLSYREGHQPFDGRYDGDYARASLIPNLAGEVAYLHREMDGEPIAWWNPTALRATVEEWLPTGRGNATCVDHLVSFIRVLGQDDQVLLGLPWIARLFQDSAEEISRRSYLLSSWLIDIRPAVTARTSLAIWQRLVDALVVAGDSKLAPYSV